MNLHESNDFNQTFSYPAVIDMLERFNLEIELDTVADLFIIPQNCHATPDVNRHNSIREEIVTDR